MVSETQSSDCMEQRAGDGVECHINCLRATTLPVTPLSPGEPPEALDLSAVPRVYHNLGAVFSKDGARSLLPHRPYGCAIDLLPGTPLLSGGLYSLTQQ